MVDMILNYYG